MVRLYILFLLSGFGLCKEHSSFDKSTYRNESFDGEKLDATIVSLITSIEKHVFPQAYRALTVSNTSIACTMSLFRFMTDLKRLKIWAWKMLDASSKPSAGMLEGTILVLGDYDECLDINVRNPRGKSLFRGKYCTIRLRPFSQTSSVLKGMKKSRFISEFLRIINLKLTQIDGIGFHVGICLPSTCSAQELNQMVRTATRNFITPSEVNCETKTKKKLNAVQIAILCIFSVFGFMVLLGTCLEVIHHYAGLKIKSGEIKRLLIGFSLHTNTRHLFCTVQHDTKLSALRGCRVLSAFWVILVHIYFLRFEFHLVKYRRLLQLQNWHESKVLFKTVTLGSLSLDTFFVLSGTLFLYQNWQKPEKSTRPIRLILFIIRRAVRILPIEMALVGVVMILPLLTNGPIADFTLRDFYTSCKYNWWLIPLFAQNIYPMDKMCLLHTWYISALFQIFLLTFWIVFLLYRWPKFGIAMNVTVISIGCLLTGLLMSYYNLPSTYSTLPSKINTNDLRKFSVITHTSPATYVPSYCIGIFLGYAIVKINTPKIKPWIQIIFWLASTCGALTALYGSYYFNEERDREINITYAALHRALWSSSISWMLFACVTGYGGIIGKLLSWKVLVVLDKLSLMIYLVHPLVITFYDAVSRSLTNLGHIEQGYLYFATITATVIISCFLNVSIEQPLRAIDSFISSMFSRSVVPSPDIEQPQIASSYNNRLVSCNNIIFPSSIDVREVKK